MPLEPLGKPLHDAYFNVREGEKVTMIHLFGIRYADEIKLCGASRRDLAITAGIQESYATEISKGVRLAQYVTVR